MQAETDSLGDFGGGNRQGKAQKARAGPDGALFIESIDGTKPLGTTTSCLEYLLVSFSQHFALKPKQAAGLLTQGGKYLAHIIAKGLRGKYEPVVSWYQAVFGTLKHLVSLVVKEEVNGSVSLVLSALRPGFLSKNLETAQWTCRIFVKLAGELQERGMMKLAWEWFSGEGGGVDACIIVCKRFRLDVKAAAVNTLVLYSHGNFSEMFTILFRNYLGESLQYLLTVNEFLPDLCEIKGAKQELISTGVIDIWVDFALKESDELAKKTTEVRLAAISLLCDLWSRFPSKIGESEETPESILAALKRSSRDRQLLLRVRTIQFASTARLFALLDQFSEEKDAYAPIVYKTLTFLLVENYPMESMRDFMLTNFIMTFKKNPAIPIGILLDPLLKQMQVSDLDLANVTDFDFFMMIAKHSRLNVKNAIQVLDLLGKFYLSSPGFGRAAGIPFVIICTRFIDSVPLQEYLFRFCKYALKLVVDFEKQRKAQGQKKMPKYLTNALAIAGLSDEIPEEAISGQRRIMAYDMVTRVITMGNIGLNIRLKEEIISCSFSIRKDTGRHSKGMMVVLNLFGNPDEILTQAEDAEQKTALGLSTDQSDTSTSRKNRVSFIRSYVGNFAAPKQVKPSSKMPKRRVLMAIEDAKRKREEKEMKEKMLEDEKQQLADRLRKGLKRQLETVKLLSGRISEKAIILPEGQEFSQELYYVDLSEESPGDQEGVNWVLRRYSRVLKFLYKKFASSGYRKREAHDIDALVQQMGLITEAEFYSLLKSQGIDPKVLPKEAYSSIFKTFCLKTHRDENTRVDYEGYLGLVIQVALYYFSHCKGKDLSVYPPAVSVHALFGLFRSASADDGVSIRFYDEPDPGAGDREVVKKLNLLLAKTPSAQLPEGYRRVTDKELEVKYEIPQTVQIRESAKVSLEILDDLLCETVGVHVLEPVFTFVDVTRARGVLATPALPQSVIATVRGESQESAPALSVSKPLATIDPEIRSLAYLLSSQYPPDLLQEVARTLDDLIYSVQMKSSSVLSKSQKNAAAVSNKVRLEREMKEKQEAAAKEKAEEKRRLRQQVVKEQTEKVKAERKAKEEAEKQAEMAAKKKKREMLKKRAEEWKKATEGKRAEAEKKKAEAREDPAEAARRKQEEEQRRKTQLDFLSKQRKLLSEQNQGKVQKREDSLKRMEEEAKQRTMMREQSKQRLLQKLEKDRKKQSEQRSQREQLTKLLVQPGFAEVFQEYEKSLEAVFVHYCKITTRADQDPTLARTSLQFTGFNKFATQFEIYPNVVSAEFSLGVFRQLTKDRPVAETPVIALTFDEFKQAILRIAVEAMPKVRELVGSSDTHTEFDVDSLRSFLSYLMLTPDVKQTQKTLQGLTTQTQMRKADELLRSPGFSKNSTLNSLSKVRSLPRLQDAE